MLVNRRIGNQSLVIIIVNTTYAKVQHNQNITILTLPDKYTKEKKKKKMKITNHNPDIPYCCA